LSEAAGLVDRSNSQMKTTLDDNRRSVDGLVGELTAKTEQLSATVTAKIEQLNQALANNTERLTDALGRKTEGVINEFGTKTEALEQRLKRFGALLTESFETSEARARDIARVIADASTEGTRAISEQYAQVRSTSEQESRRTAEALRAIYDQSSSDTTGLFRQTAEQFGEIVRDLKAMTGEMQRELEATRDHLRKGILELPQETADRTAQMRRVIVDQIEALAELNRIVARHGRGFDAPEVAQRGREERRGREENAAAGGARASVARPAPQPESRPAPRADARPTGDGRTGWLSELLTRASREDETPARGDERPARHNLDSLDSISADIARMIDDEAAVDVWDRYQRGERNAFSRRLYTLQGQQTFDEIRRRYRADRDFRQTVDRYV